MLYKELINNVLKLITTQVNILNKINKINKKLIKIRLTIPQKMKSQSLPAWDHTSSSVHARGCLVDKESSPRENSQVVLEASTS